MPELQRAKVVTFFETQCNLTLCYPFKRNGIPNIIERMLYYDFISDKTRLASTLPFCIYYTAKSYTFYTLK